MSKKRLGRWVIVLFLLAALPMMTAVMAQGQEPVQKGMSPSTEVGESSAPAWNVWESEPNNTMAQADVMALGDVMGADFNYEGDVDFFKFYVESHDTSLLVDTDGQVFNSGVDTMVWLYDAGGHEIGFNDDEGDYADQHDSLHYNVLRPGWHYVKVAEFNDEYDWTYDLIVSSPLLISAAAAKLGTGNVAGISFRSEDILAHSDLNDGQEKWVLFLDAGDIGIVKPIVNLSTGWEPTPGTGSQSLAVSFSANQVLTDHTGVARTFKPTDWAMLNFERIGPNPILTEWVEHHPGALHGLTTASEKLDALAMWSWSDGVGNWTADLYFSTVGAAAVPRSGGGVLKLADEDVYRSWTDQGHAPYWENFAEMDGSTIYGLAGEDVFAADYDQETGLTYLTILGTGNIGGQAVTQKDIFMAQYALEGAWEYEGIVWHGPDHGWNYNIDAFDWPGD